MNHLEKIEGFFFEKPLPKIELPLPPIDGAKMVQLHKHEHLYKHRFLAYQLAHSAPFLLPCNLNMPVDEFMLNPEGLETISRATLAPEDEFLLTEELYTSKKDMVPE